MLHETVRRLLALIHRQQFDSDLEEEMRLHRELREQEEIERGLSAQEAHYAVQRRFGNDLLLREKSRDMWGWNWLEQIVQDVRYGLRVLVKNPGFTAVAVRTLALGIGANTAIFSVVSAVLLKPLPYLEPQRLVHMNWQFPQDLVPSVSASEFLYWKDNSRVFDAVAAYDLLSSGGNLQTGGGPQYVRVLHVSGDFFRVLGANPVVGRSFLPEEVRPNGPQVVVLSHALWQSRYGGDRALLGREVLMNGQSYTVVGIMPASFEFTPATDLWLPLQLVMNPQDQAHNYLMLGRLESATSLEKAQANMGAVLAQFRREYPGTVQPNERGIVLAPFQKWLVGDVRPSLLILLGAVGLVLLIAGANVTNLLLARTMARKAELALRAALGASGFRLFRQFLTESLLVALLGGAAALVAAPWTLAALVALIPRNVPLSPFSPFNAASGHIRVDLPVLSFALLLSLALGVGVGLAPSLGMSDLDLVRALKEGGRTLAGYGHQRLRNVLVVSEAALSIVLLVGAVLLIRTFFALHSVRPGFRSEGVWALQMSLPPERFKSTGEVWRFERQAAQLLKALPGVESAATVSSLPLEPGLNFGIEVEKGRKKQGAYIECRAIDGAYFETMGIPMLRGRHFLEADTASSDPVVIVNQSLARHLWGEQNPIGEQVLSEAIPTRRVVGVVGDTKEWGLDQPAPLTIFVPQSQMPDGITLMTNGAFLTSWVVKSRAPLDFRTVQRAVREVDPDQPVVNLRSMSQVVSESIAPERFVTFLLGIFGGLALILTAIGIYGVISYSVTQRTHEVGVRMALGATRGIVLKMIVRQGLRLTLIGTAIGLLGALGLTRVLKSMLFGVTPTDPVAFVAVSILLAAVALLASYIPARRATMVDPMDALRNE
jgi:predicted permease